MIKPIRRNISHDDNSATLATCDQHLIDRWLADGRSTNHNARAFLLWTHRNGHTSGVTIPHRPVGGPGVRIEDDERWALVRRFLHDDAIAIADRVAGLLLLLYGQPLTKVAHIKREQILSSAHGASIVLGTKPLELQEPVGELVLQLANNHRGRAALGPTNDHPWLFPGAAPGRPISPRTLMTRLQAFSVRARAGRNTTLIMDPGRPGPSRRPEQAAGHRHQHRNLLDATGPDRRRLPRRGGAPTGSEYFPLITASPLRRPVADTVCSARLRR